MTAVDDVSFRVEPGELVTLLGPSSCGKTTTLRMVAGLEPVASGRILIGGRDVTLRAANEHDVSMVFQSYALFPHMTVLEYPTDGTGPETRTPGPCLLPLCGRLPHLCQKQGGGRAGDSEPYSISCDTPQAHGECRQKCGGGAVGTEASG